MFSSPTCKSDPPKVSQEDMYITKFGCPRHYSCCLVLNGFNVIFQFVSTIISHLATSLYSKRGLMKLRYIFLRLSTARNHELKRTKHSQALPCFVEYGRNMVFPLSVVCKSKSNMFVGTNRLYWNIVHK